jgi:hypothetical protein
MTLVRTGLSSLVSVRTGLNLLAAVRTYLGDTSSSASGVPLKWDLTPLASNAVACVVTNNNITVYTRNIDGTLGSPVTGTWTTTGGSATDAGRTPAETTSNFVGLSTAPAAAQRCWMFFNDTQDVEWILPGHPLNPQTKTRTPLDRPFGLFIQGGRNHRMLYAVIGFSKNWATTTNGAQGQNVPAGTGYFAQWNRAFYILDYTGVFDSVYCHLKAGNLYEGYNVSNGKTTNPRWRMQRCRIERTVWYNPGSGHDGGDPFQIWHGPSGFVEFDRCTLETDFQGLFLAWNDSQPTPRDVFPQGFDIANLNIRELNGPGTFLYYNTKGGLGDSPPATTLSNVLLCDVTTPTRALQGSMASTNGVTGVTSPDGNTLDWTTVSAANTQGAVTRVTANYVIPGVGDKDFAPAAYVGFTTDTAWSGWASGGGSSQVGYPATYQATY